MIEQEAIAAVATHLEIMLSSNDFVINKEMLAGRIQNLIQNNFPKLIAILYRLDISEAKLKQLLKVNPQHDAAMIITDLIIERQIEKIRSRRAFPPGENDIDESEKW